MPVSKRVPIESQPRVLAENEVEITIGDARPIVVTVVIPGEGKNSEAHLPVTFRGSRGIRNYVMCLTRSSVSVCGASAQKLESWWRLK